MVLLELRIDTASSSLERLFQVNNFNECVVITAWNPIGRIAHQVEENRKDNQRLWDKLLGMGYLVLPAWGVPDAPVWPPEASWLVLGLSKTKGLNLAEEFAQLAFVHCALDKQNKAVPRLVWTEGSSQENNDAFKSTTYMTAPLDIHQGTSLQMWLRGTGARRFQYSAVPSDHALFQTPYEDGYLIWLDA